jgi:hypothetical protein
VGKISPWQEYLQAKWTASLYEQFKDIKLIWEKVTHGSEEEKSTIDEELSNIFYQQVLPSVLKLFGNELITTLSLAEFRDIVAKITGINLDKDYVARFPGFKDWATKD